MSTIASMGMAQNQPVTLKRRSDADKEAYYLAHIAEQSQEIARLSARVRELEGQLELLSSASLFAITELEDRLKAKSLPKPVDSAQPAILGDGADSQGAEPGERG